MWVKDLLNLSFLRRSKRLNWRAIVDTSLYNHREGMRDKLKDPKFEWPTWVLEDAVEYMENAYYGSIGEALDLLHYRLNEDQRVVEAAWKQGGHYE